MRCTLTAALLHRHALLAVALCVAAAALPLSCSAQVLLVPMDDAQSDHLRAYGLTYWCLQEPRLYECEWLLNYRCGAFVLPDRPDVRARAGHVPQLVLGGDAG